MALVHGAVNLIINWIHHQALHTVAPFEQGTLIMKGWPIIILMNNLALNLPKLRTIDTLNSVPQSLPLKKRSASSSQVEKCLNSLNLFRSLLEGMPLQKYKLVRDVVRSLKVHQYPHNSIIYEIGQQAYQLFFCLRGKVSIAISEETINTNRKTERNASPAKAKMSARSIALSQSVKGSKVIGSQKQMQNPQIEIEMTEVDLIEEGCGFGEAEFIAETRREVRATTVGDCLIGRLELSAFSDVLQSYRQRVYFKKKDMFEACPLFKNIDPVKLQFIVSNAKPLTFNISDQLVKQGEPLQYIYLVDKGQVSLWTEGQSFSAQSDKNLDFPSKRERICIGLYQTGCFIGDLELALGKRNQANAVAATEKVEVYACNKKIVMSQMSEDMLNKAAALYQLKNDAKISKIKKYKTAKSKIELTHQSKTLAALTPEQIHFKKLIKKRHYEEKETLIGSSSAQDIQKMVRKKALRLKTQPDAADEPVLEIFPSRSEKKRSHSPGAFNPMTVINSLENKFNKKNQETIAQYKSEHMTEEDDVSKIRSMLIKIQRSNISFKTVRQGYSQSMMKVNSILGSKRKSPHKEQITKMIRQIGRYARG